MPNLKVGKNQVEYNQIGGGPDLLLLPTLLAEMTVYDDVIDELSARYRVTRINFPGFGGSTGPIGQTVDSYADLVAETMSALCLSGDTHVVGNGFGGFVAGSLAIHHGRSFKKLVLVDTGPGFPEPAKEPLRILAKKAQTEGMDSVLDAAIKRMFPEDFIRNNPSIMERRRLHLSKADPFLFANAALALTFLDNRPRLGEIKNPTQIIVGLADATTPPALSYELNSGISNSELQELPGIGHCPQLQDPRLFLDAMLTFLK
ncbi:MAG: hydrolase [Rhodospirillaceae bacterium]|nr:hydrolase [Rhodospirillaceae bacterium]|tara:strand:- start:1845 stop:2624 length:780 start_codon:yes stop_codon:yes gene_type:complete